MLVRKPKNVSKSLETLPLRLDSNVYLYEELEKSIALYEAYRIGDTMPVTVRRVGTWHNYRGLRLTSPNLWERRRDLQGFNVTISVAHVTLHSYLNIFPLVNCMYISSFQYNDRWTGVSKFADGSIKLVGKQPDTWRILAKFLNIT